MSNKVAEPDHLFVCCACGKTSSTRYGFTGEPGAYVSTASQGWDESCMMHAVEVAVDRIVWNAAKTRAIRVDDVGG